MKVSLFVTCLGDIFYVKASQATVELLERFGCKVEFPATQTCCGQPAYNSGYEKNTKEVAKHMIKVFEDANYVVTPSGSCAYMIHTYENLFLDDPVWFERARLFKEKTYELTQFLVEILKVDNTGATLYGKATYHTSCHMTRLLGIKDAPFTLLNHVVGLELIDLPNREDCCGFGGTFAVKMSDISEQMVDEKVDHIISTGANLLIGADNACLMNIEGRLQRRNANVKVMHIAEVLNHRGGE